MVWVPLTRGKVALVDDEDAARVLVYTWHATPGTRTWYAQTHVEGGRKVSMHRFIMDAPDGVEVDHKNGDGLDNRRSNLRFATNVQQQANQRTRWTSTSGYRGVGLHKRSGRYRAYGTAAGRQVSLGYYDHPEDAARAYDAWARSIFGDYAAVNFPTTPPDIVPVPAQPPQRTRQSRRVAVPAAERFWSYVDKTTEHWLWRGGVSPQGYGVFHVGTQGQSVLAHRYAYTLSHGSIPPGHVVHHTCDVLLCVRHLEALTYKEHMATMRGVVKRTWPPCAVCGDPNGRRQYRGVSPIRISGQHFGIDGLLCGRCYNRLRRQAQRSCN